MPSFNRPLVPGFLKRLDNYLLKNKPDLWSTRVHLTIWYSLLATIVVTGLYYLANGDARADRFERTWVPYTLTLSVIGLIIYIFYVVRFNVFKRFGNLNIFKHGAMQFVCTTAAIASLALPNIVPIIAEGIWAHAQYTKVEIAQDAAQINFQYHIVERTADQPWSNSSVKIVSDTNDPHLVVWIDSATYYQQLRQDSITAGLILNDGSYDAQAAVAQAAQAALISGGTSKMIKTWKPYAARNDAHSEDIVFGNTDIFIHESIADSLLRQQDSIVSKGNNEFIFYSCPDLITCSSPFEQVDDEQINDSTILLSSNMKIYYKLKAYKTQTDPNAELNKFYYLYNKYITARQKDKLSTDTYGNQSDRNNATVREVEDSMDNIARKMEQCSARNLLMSFNAVIIAAMCFSILLLIFRHTTSKAFWLSALTFILLFILTALVAISIRSFNHPQYLLLAYSLVFILIACTTYSASHRTLFHGIGINIAVLALCALPATIFSVLYLNAQEAYGNIASTQISTPAQKAMLMQVATKVERFENTLTYLPLITCVICIALFAFLIAPLYKKWYSMPSN
jgi:hypothetical protein